MSGEVLKLKIVLYFLAILIAIILQKKSSQKVRGILVLLILCISTFLMANSQIIEGGDNWSYWIHYEKIVDSQGFEPGYLLLQNLGYSLGLSYIEFRTLFILLFSIILFIGISRLTTNYGYVYNLYLLYFIFKDNEQLRFFAATVLVVVGLKYLVYDTKLSVVKYLIFVAIACTFHKTAFIFAALSFAKLPDSWKKYFIKVAQAFAVVFVALAIANRELIISLLTLIDKDKGVGYSTAGNVRFGFIIPLGLFIYNYLIINKINKRVSMLKFSDNNDVYIKLGLSKKVKKVYELSNLLHYMKFLTLISLCTVPLLLINIHFYRIGRSVFFISLIAIAEYHKHINKDARLKIRLEVLGLLALFCIFDFIIFGNFTNQVFTLFM